MTLAPRFIAVLLVVGASLWALALSAAPDEPFSTDSAVLVSIGLLMFSVIAAIGLLLPRGRWARNLARVVLALELVLALATPLEGWALAALGASAAGLVGIQGRWLDGWLRRLPAALGPGLRPMLFVLGALALVPAIGLASPSGVEIGQGLLGAFGIVTAWGYSKAHLWALWAARLITPVLTVVAALAAPPLGALGLAMFGFTLSALAWSEETRLAISPLMDSLPGPRQVRPKPGGDT